MKGTIIALVAATLAGACTLTAAQQTALVTAAVIVTPDAVKAEMLKGCPALMAVGNTAAAIATAYKAVESVQGAAKNVNDMASLGCGLLALSVPAG